MIKLQRVGGDYVFTADNEAKTEVRINEEFVEGANTNWMIGTTGTLYLGSDPPLHGTWSYEPKWELGMNSLEYIVWRCPECGRQERLHPDDPESRPTTYCTNHEHEEGRENRPEHQRYVFVAAFSS